MPFTPSPSDNFTFGLWTVGNTGRDPFGEPTRPRLSPAEIVELLGEVGGVRGVNFHDNDLIPIDASPAESRQIKADFARALKRHKLKVAMATTNLFTDPAFKDGAFTSNDAEVRAYAIQKTMRGMDLGAEFGAKIYVFWGGREGTETDAAKDPIESEARFRRAIDFLCDYSRSKNYGYRFALEAKPNEPRGHMFFPTTGSYLAFIATLKHPGMVGVNPEVAHEHMAGLNFSHAVAQALAANKLFHIDLNDQQFGRYDQDFRFGAADIKSAFFLVKLLEDNAYKGFRHFDAHAYRTSDRKDVIEFARGCMRTYLILKDKARRWNADPEVRRLQRTIRRDNARLDELWSRYSATSAAALSRREFDRQAMAARPLPYERLDQRTMEILLGV
ncbi:MAG: xylose isomerase [Phycisphaeraceae bacterium]|nr:xylose isomerase [Phycisphaeraceae bacterium]